MEKVDRSIVVRVTESEAKAIETAAAADGRSVSAWCRRILVGDIDLEVKSPLWPPVPPHHRCSKHKRLDCPTCRT